jgi:hypothetical protein
MVLFPSALVAAAPVRIDPDRMLNMNGQRMFVVGLYENPKDDAVLRQAVDAGINLIRATDAASLDRLQAAGAFGWVHTGTDIDLSERRDDRERALQKRVLELGPHPALLVWEVPDEALWNVWYRPYRWMHDTQPRLHRQSIAALEDAGLAERLTGEVDKVDELLERGEFSAAEALADQVWQAMNQAQPKPALRLSDSADKAKQLEQGMVAGYQYLKSIGLPQPIWMNHAPRNQLDQLARFNKGADIVGCDIYPSPSYRTGHSDISDRSISSVGAYTARMQDAAPGKPVWMVLQGFGWKDLSIARTETKKQTMERPDSAAVRFMTYDAIARGARGVIYYGTDNIEKDSALWKALLAQAGELLDQHHVWSAPDAELELNVVIEESWGSIDKGVELLPKSVGGETWILAVNEWQGPLTYSIQGLEAFEGTRFRDQQANRHATVKNGVLTLTIRGQGVHILAPVAASPGSQE